MSLSKIEIFKEAKERAFDCMSEKEIKAYETMKTCASFSRLIIFFLAMSFICILCQFNTYFFLLSGLLCAFVLFVISCIFIFNSPFRGFYAFVNNKINDIIPQIKREIKQSKNEVANLSDAMIYWNYLRKSAATTQSSYFYNKFLECIVDNINHRDLNGNTILHYMLMEEPQSPFIAQALLLHADIYLTNNKGISAYALLQEHKPEYLIFIEKNQLINRTSTSASRPLARL